MVQVADQSWLNQFYGTEWTRLDDGKYNARPFLHPLPAADEPRRPIAEPRIWHWHGYKPADVRCWLTAMENGSWPERAWRRPACQGTHRGSCTYKPIRGSGCRYYGRITPGKCYLRTYAYLLGEHERFLAMASM